MVLGTIFSKFLLHVVSECLRKAPLWSEEVSRLTLSADWSVGQNKHDFRLPALGSLHGQTSGG